MNSTNESAEEQLANLRARVQEIRTAKKWLTEYRINASVAESKALTDYYSWLDKQEQRTIAMGMRIKAE